VRRYDHAWLAAWSLGHVTGLAANLISVGNARSGPI
jgi:hypothetical protein